MKNYSIWKDKDIRKNFNSKSLDKNIECDTLIIGAGITGISAYYHLKKSNQNIIVVEQNKVGMGVTANSTGKLTYLQDNIYNNILDNYDFETATKYLESQLKAINITKNIIKTNNINCDLTKTKSYIYTNKEEEIEKITKLKEFLEKNNVKVSETNNNLVESKYMISVDETYLFNPLKFIYELVNKANLCNIYENTSIKKIEKQNESYICYTDNNKIICKNVILASHYPYFIIPFLFPIRSNLEKSYICSGNKKIDNISLISYNKPFISIRNYKDSIIYLSNSHNNSSTVSDKDNFQELIKKAKKLDFEPNHIWSNIDIITSDKLPYIGKIEDNFYIATGYNTWGMTNGILGGYLLSEILLKNNNEYANLFDPKRKIKNSITNIPLNSYYNLKGFINGSITKNNFIEQKKLSGKKICIYKSEFGEHKVYQKCPHLGCKLIFNEVEKTWDCPCHGSRFDLNGKCFNGPSNSDISYKEDNI